ncbi:PilZ domain-containing protein [Oceanibacterium hippocampi]|uniref:PilZ domain-containing protein n=1 Tax=Oceanibacterium hippocampi TaxID=745714 RepID=A0A1Y5TVA3_9PROT|nr:PilZ domain-containing protein [Oceanibacterium hippocampi]SLN72866.1 hypothetical protein OCH7691_03522 [Oceanibacterium hippocampi]
MGLFGPKRANMPGHDRRQYVRVSNRVLKIIIEGRAYRTADWSAGGFRLDDRPEGLSISDNVDGIIRGIGFGVPGDFTAQVVRFPAEGGVAMRFVDIHGRCFSALLELSGN